MKPKFVVVLLLAVSALAQRPTHAQGTRRYLPAMIPPDAWGNFFTNFDREVQDTVKGIDAGWIRFDYNTYNGAGTPPLYGGAGLAGGFFMNPGVSVKPGFTLSWIQLITSQTTFGSHGRTPPYTDVLPGATSPSYPYQSLPGGVAPVPAPTLPFQDFPSRNWSDGAQTWLAELGLTCIGPANPAGVREVRVVGTFFWGFEFFDPSTNPGHITDRLEPSFWSSGGATQEYINTMNAAWRDITGPLPPGQDWYDFANNSNCFIPEPAAIVIWALLAGWGINRRRTTFG